MQTNCSQYRYFLEAEENATDEDAWTKQPSCISQTEKLLEMVFLKKIWSILYLLVTRIQICRFFAPLIRMFEGLYTNPNLDPILYWSEFSSGEILI
jgi:hypothetical protein